MKEYDSLSDNEKRNMLASVANLYYNVEMTQNQIAERFFTSRSKISRMLKEARQLGIVEIKILEPWDRNVELEQEFMRRFALKDVRVISVKEANNTMVLQKLGEVAAYYLDNLLNDNMILGISWGNTMYHTVKAVKTSKNIPITVVPIMGQCKDSRERFLGSFERTCLCIWWNVSLHLCTIVCKLGRSQGQS